MKVWYICPKWQLALGAGAKCGSTMLAKFVQANKAARMPTADPRHGRECWSMIGPSMPRIAIVRHPVDRFASLVANIQQRAREHGNFYKQFEGMTPADMLDRMLEVGLEYEFHMQPQVLQLGPKIDQAVDLVHFKAWCEQHLPQHVAPTVENASDPVDIDARTAERVCEAYAADFALWERAWASSTSSVSAPASRT